MIAIVGLIDHRGAKAFIEPGSHDFTKAPMVAERFHWGVFRPCSPIPTRLTSGRAFRSGSARISLS